MRGGNNSGWTSSKIPAMTQQNETKWWLWWFSGRELYTSSPLLFSITNEPRCVPCVGGGKVYLFSSHGFTLVIYNFFNPHNYTCMNRKVTFAYVTWRKGLAAFCCIWCSGYVHCRVLLCQEKTKYVLLCKFPESPLDPHTQLARTRVFDVILCVIDCIHFGSRRVLVRICRNWRRRGSGIRVEVLQVHLHTLDMTKVWEKGQQSMKWRRERGGGEERRDGAQQSNT